MPKLGDGVEQQRQALEAITSDADHGRIEELQANNRRLQRLLDQRDAPGELRHRLRSTTALLSAIIRRSAETKRDLPSYAAHLEDRLDAIVRAQGRADQYGEVDLRTLVADELLKHGVLEGDRLKLAGPEIALAPRIGQVFSLAIHELAINAVEHGRLGAPDADIEVTWNVVNKGAETSMQLTWAESGSIHGEPSHRGFGTDVLTRMLPYELNADAHFSFGAEELRYAIDILDLSGVGRVVTD